ncbi:hypothetical protein F5884DRAFT_855099 [Xylogone sp. PMI_703]|nr:hypothetical protein F5884DRAFT_855099 [Xylogone sp. PMI_703]
MSLHYLGIAHFPILHQQFSPTRPKSTIEKSPAQSLTEDSKDVLIERLNDLASRLTDSSLDDSIVTAIHGDVDHIERLLRGKDKRSPSPLQANISVDGDARSSTDERRIERDPFWAPLTPTRSISMHLPSRRDSSISISHSISQLRQPTPDFEEHRQHDEKEMENMRKIASSATTLVSRLTNTITELQERREETQHIHGLLIDRAQRAADRILYLEQRLADLEDNLEENQSELKYLRIQMQAIEVQCSPYLDPSEDEDLSQSIQNWKQDWETIDKRWKNRKKTAGAPANIDYPKIIIDGP